MNIAILIILLFSCFTNFACYYVNEKDNLAGYDYGSGNRILITDRSHLHPELLANPWFEKITTTHVRQTSGVRFTIRIPRALNEHGNIIGRRARNLNLIERKLNTCIQKHVPLPKDLLSVIDQEEKEQKSEIVRNEVLKIYSFNTGPNNPSSDAIRMIERFKKIKTKLNRYSKRLTELEDRKINPEKYLNIEEAHFSEPNDVIEFFDNRFDNKNKNELTNEEINNYYDSELEDKYTDSKNREITDDHSSSDLTLESNLWFEKRIIKYWYMKNAYQYLALPKALAYHDDIISFRENNLDKIELIVNSIIHTDKPFPNDLTKLMAEETIIQESETERNKVLKAYSYDTDPNCSSRDAQILIRRFNELKQKIDRHNVFLEEIEDRKRNPEKYIQINPATNNSLNNAVNPRIIEPDQDNIIAIDGQNSKYYQKQFLAMTALGITVICLYKYKKKIDKKRSNNPLFNQYCKN